MENKLEFEPVDLTEYQWDKYEVYDINHYNWAEHEAIPIYEYIYQWDKCDISPNLKCEWDKYNKEPIYREGSKYRLFQPDSQLFTWDVYKAEATPDYDRYYYDYQWKVSTAAYPYCKRYDIAENVSYIDPSENYVPITIYEKQADPPIDELCYAVKFDGTREAISKTIYQDWFDDWFTYTKPFTTNLGYVYIEFPNGNKFLCDGNTKLECAFPRDHLDIDWKYLAFECKKQVTNAKQKYVGWPYSYTPGPNETIEWESPEYSYDLYPDGTLIPVNYQNLWMTPDSASAGATPIGNQIYIKQFRMESWADKLEVYAPNRVPTGAKYTEEFAIEHNCFYRVKPSDIDLHRMFPNYSRFVNVYLEKQTVPRQYKDIPYVKDGGEDPRQWTYSPVRIILEPREEDGVVNFYATSDQYSGYYPYMSDDFIARFVDNSDYYSLYTVPSLFRYDIYDSTHYAYSKTDKYVGRLQSTNIRAYPEGGLKLGDNDYWWLIRLNQPAYAYTGNLETGYYAEKFIFDGTPHSGETETVPGVGLCVWAYAGTGLGVFGYKQGDEYLGKAYNIEPTYYPEDGYSGDYWYIFSGTSPGAMLYKWDKYDESGETFICSVYSNIEGAYPQMGVQEGYYYVYISSQESDYIPTYNSRITSLNRHEYPDDEILDEYWYLYRGYDTRLNHYIKGDYIQDVTNTNRLRYPDNGTTISGTGDIRWYYYKDFYTEYTRGNFIESKTSYHPNSFPQNDFIIGDGWYVYTGSETMHHAEIVIDDSVLKGGIHYIQDINTENDFTLGVAASAQIDFSLYCENPADMTALLGKQFSYYTKQRYDDDWRLIGTFVLTESSTETRVTANIIGYDNVSKFDKTVDEWINSTQFPIALGDMFASLCEYCGCKPVSTVFPNSDFYVGDNFESINITGKDVLQYIAQCAGGFVIAIPTGEILIRGYQETGEIVGNNRYVKNTSAIYNTPIITSVVAKYNEDDVGVESEDGITVDSNDIVLLDGSHREDNIVNLFSGSISNHILDTEENE